MKRSATTQKDPSIDLEKAAKEAGNKAMQNLLREIKRKRKSDSEHSG
jgi:hypothetical protein